ncbi:acyltransferase [Ramlibacter sp.]|uniref:acyltransferase n=1 Tax=Ramlibacter sp. TaxID=1917967 RepID=UPI00261F33AD|nr:acyltransferase [Ramlibacter sp.]MDB5957147.1 hypothetical protein [Ramlibacter sp.]
MAQHLITPPSLMTALYRYLADRLTPRAHVPHRWELKNRFLRKLGATVGRGVAVDEGFEWLLAAGRLVLEDYAVIGKNVHVYNFSDVTIGRFAMFAADIVISNGGHDKDSFVPFSGPLTIGRGVWIGVGATISGANLVVGDNAIVGAGALVIDDVPPGAIVAGVPAKVIGYRNLPDKVWHLGNTWFCPHTFEPLDS